MPCTSRAGRTASCRSRPPSRRSCRRPSACARAAKIRGDDVVSFGFIGDGATSEGDFHAAMNFAAVCKAPCVLRLPEQPVGDLGAALEADGERRRSRSRPSPTACRACASTATTCSRSSVPSREAHARARTGGGPTFVELVTYRLGGHSSSDDPTRYRDESDAEPWLLVDPIERFEAHLRAKAASIAARKAAMLEAIRARIDAAIKAAEPAPPPPSDALRRRVRGHARRRSRPSAPWSSARSSGPRKEPSRCEDDASLRDRRRPRRLRRGDPAAQLGLEDDRRRARRARRRLPQRRLHPVEGLIDAAKLYEKIRTADECGIHASGVTVDLAKMRTWKNAVVTRMTNGVAVLLKRNGVTVDQGHGAVHRARRDRGRARPTAARRRSRARAVPDRRRLAPVRPARRSRSTASGSSRRPRRSTSTASRRACSSSAAASSASRSACTSRSSAPS